MSARQEGGNGPIEARRPRVGKLAAVGCALVAAGGAAAALGLLLEGGAPRLGFGYLWGFAFLWCLVLGSIFFVALHHVTGAVWSVVIRRVAEMLAAPIVLVALLFAPVLVFALFPETFRLFPWLDSAHVAGDRLLEHKAPYLNLGFFAARAAIFFAAWIGFGLYFVKKSLRQDQAAGPAAAAPGIRGAASVFMVVFALTVTFASFDWLMSLEPHWFSTIFGVYVFSGMTLTALAAITIAVVWMRSQGLLGREVVTEEHLYSLGALLFAFSCFWGYIAFSQFMLIWYGNLPEETVYFAHRTSHGWLPVSVALAVLRFVLPFFLLLAREAKMSARRLLWVSAIVLLGELVDLYWLIMPQIHETGPRLGWHEIGPVVAMAGVILLAAARFLARHRTMATNDPRYQDSVGFHL